PSAEYGPSPRTIRTSSSSNSPGARGVCAQAHPLQRVGLDSLCAPTHPAAFNAAAPPHSGGNGPQSLHSAEPVTWNEGRPGMQSLRPSRGRSLPLGATALAGGVNFALLCRHGTAVWLVLEPLDGGDRLAELPLDPWRHRTGYHWHIQVAGLPPAFR